MRSKSVMEGAIERAELRVAEAHSLLSKLKLKKASLELESARVVVELHQVRGYLADLEGVLKNLKEERDRR